jgi:hypothetical protein
MDKLKLSIVISGFITVIVIIIIILLVKSKKEKYSDCISNNCGKILQPGKYIIRYKDSQLSFFALSIYTILGEEPNVIFYPINSANSAGLINVRYSNGNYFPRDSSIDLYVTYNEDGNKQIQFYSNKNSKYYAQGGYLNIGSDGTATLSASMQSEGFDIITYDEGKSYYINVNNIKKYISFTDYGNKFPLTYNLLEASTFIIGIAKDMYQTTSNNGTCNCTNYCGFDWNNELSNLGWKGAICGGGIGDDGYELDCEQASNGDGSISCLCIRDDTQGFQTCDRNIGDQCSTGRPKVSNETC